MSVKVGYLLPTRENIMDQRPSGKLLLDAARQAEALGYDSVWAGDSLLARPRHEPLSLLAAVAGAAPSVEIGTAVLLPALRNPVLLAHQLATIDQISEGRLIVGAGIAADAPSIRAEFESAGVPFEKRVGRMNEGFNLCRALWRGEPVDWDGRWHVAQGELGPVPYRDGGPPIWIGGSADATHRRVGKYYDGWFPTGPDAPSIGAGMQTVRGIADEAGRNGAALACAAYLTVAISSDREAANASINTYLERYYGVSADIIRRRQACFAGSLEETLGWLRGFVDQGVQHIVLRLVGDHASMMRDIAQHRDELASA